MITASFYSETAHRVSLSSSCSPHGKGLSRVKKATAVLKRAMTQKSERWQSRDWHGNTKPDGSNPPGVMAGRDPMIRGTMLSHKGVQKIVSFCSERM